MLDELDFRKEADNIEKFTEFLERAGITDAVAPQVCACVCVFVCFGARSLRFCDTLQSDSAQLLAP